MIRCHGYGHGGSAKSASAWLALRHLRPRLHVAVKAPLPPSSPWSRNQGPTRTLGRLRLLPLRLPGLLRCAAARPQTSQHSRRSSTPLPPWKPRPSLLPRRSALRLRRHAPRQMRQRLPRPPRRSPSPRPHRRKQHLPRAREGIRPQLQIAPLPPRRRQRPRARRRLPVLRRRCRSPTPAPRRRRRRAPVVHRPRRVRRSVRRRPVSRIAHARPEPVSRLAVAPVRVVDTAVVRVPLLRPHRHSVGRPFVRRVVARHVPVADRRLLVVLRAPVAIRAAVVARRASAARWIRLRSMRTFRRR